MARPYANVQCELCRPFVSNEPQGFQQARLSAAGWGQTRPTTSIHALVLFAPGRHHSIPESSKLHVEKVLAI